MARYFFHVVNNRLYVDGVGTECASADEVKSMAVRAAGEMLRDHGAELWQTRQWFMFVTDAENRTHLKLALEAEDLSGRLVGQPLVTEVRDD